MRTLQIRNLNAYVHKRRCLWRVEVDSRCLTAIIAPHVAADRRPVGGRPLGKGVSVLLPGPILLD